MSDKKNIPVDFLFEVSWEVCNKVGGIHTVLQSKARQIVGHFGKKYWLIGPYFIDKIKGQFEEHLPPPELKILFEQLEKEGIKCHYGKWLIESEPNVILIDFLNFWPKLNQIKYWLWEKFGVDSLNSPRDFDEPVVFSYAAGFFIERFWQAQNNSSASSLSASSLSASPDFIEDSGRSRNSLYNKKIIAHFHEWLTAAGLLYLKANNAEIATVFTTHATTLGRTLAANNVKIYEKLEEIKVKDEIYKYGIQAKHLIEKSAAESATVFTTVSEITKLEAKSFLGKSADILLPNGLALEEFPSFEEASIKHRLERRRIREFILYYFFPYYSFDIENTLFYFISCRYEFFNKGTDILISALAKTNQRLKNEKSKKTIVVFFWVPLEIRSLNLELLENKTLYQDIKDYFEETIEDIKDRLINALISESQINQKVLFCKDFLFEIKKKILQFKKSVPSSSKEKEKSPPLVTHELADKTNLILEKFRLLNLTNNKDDKVKVILYPVYLTGMDGLLNLNHYESIIGSHLGIFPSYYEPWGYTPQETAALGVASVTTDLTGFGQHIKDKITNKKNPGIFILNRFGKDDSRVIDQLADILWRYSQFSHRQRVENKISARYLAEQADWKFLINNYLKAYEIALQKIKS